MTPKTDVEDFIAQKTLAIAGVSRSGKKFGNSIFKELTSKGYTLLPVHPEADTVNGVKAVKSVSELPDNTGGIIVVVKPERSEDLVRAAAEKGIKRVWLQQGTESDAAVSLAREKGLTVIAKECILMFAEPAALPHRIHRFIWKLLGKLPK